MRYWAMLSLLITLAGTARSQNRPKYETVPDRTVLVAIGSQANCPLKIEDATFLKSVGKAGGVITYRIRNVSNKPIWFVSVMIQSSLGTSENFQPMPRVKKILLPNETLESATKGLDYDVVGQYSPAQDERPSHNGLKALYLLLVEKVEFTDGSTYEDNKTLAALVQFFDERQ